MEFLVYKGNEVWINVATKGKMGLEGKLEREIDVRGDADKFFKVFTKEMHLLPTVCSEHLESVEVHHGDWETVGSVKHWNYNLDGNPMNLKEKVEEVDAEKRSIILKVVEGDILKHHYKHFKVTIQVTPKEEGCLVKWTLDYEKWNDDISPPDAYLDIAVKATRATEAHLLNE